MEYIGIVSRDEKHVGVVFPQAPGCSTFADTLEELVPLAQEALEGWLTSWLATGETPPKPQPMSANGAQTIAVQVAPDLARRIESMRARP